MNNNQTFLLRDMTLAPYLQMATALIGKSRRIGGNQFRHVWATVGILIDYKIIDSITLKAAALHDLKEDAVEEYFPNKIRAIDSDGDEVVRVVEELSKDPNELKTDYLIRVMTKGSDRAKIIKLADRISNLTDIQLGVLDFDRIKKMLDETYECILPYAEIINKDMYTEICDLMGSRTRYMHQTIELVINKMICTVRHSVLEMEKEAAEQTHSVIDDTINNIRTISTLGTLDQKEILRMLSVDMDKLPKIVHDSLFKVIDEINTKEFIQELSKPYQSAAINK